MKLSEGTGKTSFDNKFTVTLLVLLFLYLILYFYKLGSIGLIDVDEPRYAEAGREILESGNWVVPYFNYMERFDKPILFYWLEALSMKIFGVNEFAARLPSAISSISCISIVFYFINFFYGVSAGLLASLVLTSCFEFAALSRFSVTDMTLASFICASILSFFLGYSQLLTSHKFASQQINEFSYWYISGFICLALAFLTKGPVALVLIGVILIPFFWWIRKLNYFFNNYSFWVGLCVFIVLVFPWYLAVHSATKGEFTSTFFGLHNFSRYTSVVSGHKGSLFYFIPVILIGFLPWTFFLPTSILYVIKQGLHNIARSQKEQILWLCLWWFLITFLFFSLSKTKLLTYVLSLFPALSIIVSIWFNSLLTKCSSNRGLIIGLGCFFVFCLILVSISLFNLDILLPREVKNLKLDFYMVSLVFLLFVGISMSWASSHKDISMSISILLSTFLLFYFCLITFILPKIDKHSQKLLRTFAQSTPSDVEIATYQIVKPSLTFYSKRQIQKIDSIAKLQKKLEESNKFAFVTKKNFLENAQLKNSYLWGKDSRYVFYTNYPNNKNEL